MRNYFKYWLYLAIGSCIFLAHAGAYEDFFQATRTDDAGTVRELITRGFDPNALDETGQPALALAAREGALRVAEALLTRPELKLDARNRAGETPLMLAALKGHASLVKRLLERGAAVNQAGWSALHYAATGPDSDIVRLLIERGATLDARSPNATTPLMMAAQYGSEASVQVLLAGREQLAERRQAPRR
jgi:uncharacterized protein